PEYYSPIKQIGKDFHATLDGQLAMQDIDQFIEQSKALTIEYNEALTWQTNSTLELSVVDYKSDDAYLLNDINLSLPEKVFIRFVGSIGARKSMFINLFAGRTKVTQAKININQTEVQTLHDEHWFENLAYIPQQPYIFPASIYDHIRFYEPNASRASVPK